MLFSQLHRSPFEGIPVLPRWCYLINRNLRASPFLPKHAQACTNTGVLSNHARHDSTEVCIPQKHTITVSGTSVSGSFLAKVTTKTERNPWPSASGRLGQGLGLGAHFLRNLVDA